MALVFFFIWHECIGCSEDPPVYQVVYYASFAIVFEFGWAAVQIAQLSLIPELTADKNAQVGLNAIRCACHCSIDAMGMIVYSMALLSPHPNMV